MSEAIRSIRQTPELAALLEHADHIDVKTVTGSADLRAFVAGMFSYHPGWMTALYTVRGGFVRLLGLRQRGVPAPLSLRPEDVPMRRGAKVAFFTVRMVEEERYWIASAEDAHLEALLGVIIESLPGSSQRRFHVLTIVHYRNWAGPVYFQVIRPFHHLVVGRMARAGARRPNE